MNLEIPYTRDQIDKIGNTIIYLAEKIQPLSKTKLLKLVYLIEELSIKKYGLPFLNLRFDVWKLGPVARDIFVELSSESVLLANYISKKQDAENNTFIYPSVGFCDDEFSDNEIELLDLVIATYNGMTAAQLIELTHRKHSPWYLAAKSNDVLDYLEKGLMNSTEIEIDLAVLLNDMPEKKEFYLEQKVYLTQSKALKF